MRRIHASIVVVLALARSADAQCSEWDSRFTPSGVDGTVYAMAVHDDGSGSALYVGGAFEVAGGATVHHVARWNGHGWSQVGGGTDGDVNALCVYDDGGGAALYAGGTFTTAGGASASRVAKWNGTSWTPLASGISGVVSALAVCDVGSGPRLYAAGNFLVAGASDAHHVAAWDGSTWSALGTGLDEFATSLAVFDAGAGLGLYVGGSFSTAGGAAAVRVARWDGAGWSGLGSGPDQLVRALAVSGSALYAGGEFTMVGSVNAMHIARWNGSIWSAVGPGVNSAVRALASIEEGAGSALYVGGDGVVESGSSPFIAKWNGVNFAAVGGGANASVHALCKYDDGSGAALHAGGAFTRVGTPVGVGAMRIAKWDGSKWSRLGQEPGVDKEILAFATFDDGTGARLYAGGGFSSAGGGESRGIARWEHGAWSASGSGIVSHDSTHPFFGDAWIQAFAVLDTGPGFLLYAGGRFSKIDGVQASNVAQWDGANWFPVGTGLGDEDSSVAALALYDEGTGVAVYAGGIFHTTGGGAYFVARWDGSSWSPLATQPSGMVRALAVFDDGAGTALYAGGQFDTVAGSSANRIARWDGSNWSPLGSGMSGGSPPTVFALAVHDDGSGNALYAAGDFAMAGGVVASRIAKWNGSSWSALGAGIGPATGVVRVLTLSVFDDGAGAALYAGGTFTKAGSVDASNLAKWNGANWSSVGSGVSRRGSASSVAALAVYDDGADGAPDLYAGGGFDKAGDEPSLDIAEWHGCPPGAPYCFGDGIDAVQTTRCPCGNVGEPGHGCAAFSSSHGGARLWASGSKNPNSVVLVCEGVPNNTLCAFLRSSSANAAGVVFGDGVRCVDPPVLLFGQQASGSGANARFSVTAPAPSEIAGSTVHYLVQYRNRVAGWCLPALFNASNGYSIHW